jgi:hypothetical protein
MQGKTQRAFSGLATARCVALQHVSAHMRRGSGTGMTQFLGAIDTCLYIRTRYLQQDRAPFALVLRSAMEVRECLSDDRPARTLPWADTQSGVALAKSSLPGPLPQGEPNSERKSGYA